MAEMSAFERWLVTRPFRRWLQGAVGSPLKDSLAKPAPVGLTGLMVFAAIFALACGSATVLSEPTGTPRPEPIMVRSVIVDVHTEADIPEGITIELEDGTRLRLRLADTVSRDDWDREHLNGHRRTKSRLFITYEERPGEFVVTELSE